MRLAVSLILFFAGITTLAVAKGVSESQMLLEEAKTASPQQKVVIYRNLADIYSGLPEEYTYLRKLCRVAQECQDTQNLLEALSNLAYLHIQESQQDSVDYYMQVMGDSASPLQAEPYLCYLRLRIFDKRIMGGDMNAFSEKARLLNSTRINKESPYVCIEQAFVTSKILYINHKYQEALGQLQNAVQLCVTYPSRETAKIQLFVRWRLAEIYEVLHQNQTFVSEIEEQLELQKAIIEQYYLPDRPYYPANLYYLSYYASLFSQIDLLPEEKVEAYVTEVQRMGDLTSSIDRYNLFLIMKYYYIHKKDIENSIRMVDSLLAYSPEVLPGQQQELLREKADLYQQAGKEVLAFKAFKEFTHCKDSMEASNLALRLGGMQQVYEIDKLNFENTRLTNAQKHMQATLLGVLVLLGILICTYLYFALRKAKLTQQRLHDLSLRAEQSEHQKTAFINQMCHEIRTPLNAISGFSQMVTDLSLDELTRGEMREMISKNSEQLGSMIEQMLTVAGLSGAEVAPIESSSVYLEALCRQELGKLQLRGKKNLTYRLQLPRESLMITADEKLLAQALYGLLDNAEKFTSEGEITLAVELDKRDKIVRITVTDTGCGIPADKAEMVFERFTKLNSFSVGNGLGLYLSRLIVTRHDGRVYIDTEYRRGTRVVMELPWGGEFSDSSNSDN